VTSLSLAGQKEFLPSVKNTVVFSLVWQGRRPSQFRVSKKTGNWSRAESDSGQAAGESLRGIFSDLAKIAFESGKVASQRSRSPFTIGATPHCWESSHHGGKRDALPVPTGSRKEKRLEPSRPKKSDEKN